MALLAYYRRTAEDESRVEYAFGASREAMDRRLVIDKTTRESRVLDGREDHEFRGTVAQIWRQAARDGTWPETGVLAA